MIAVVRAVKDGWAGALIDEGTAATVWVCTHHHPNPIHAQACARMERRVRTAAADVDLNTLHAHLDAVDRVAERRAEADL